MKHKIELICLIGLIVLNPMSAQADENILANQNILVEASPLFFAGGVSIGSAYIGHKAGKENSARSIELINSAKEAKSAQTAILFQAAKPYQEQLERINQQIENVKSAMAHERGKNLEHLEARHTQLLLDRIALKREIKDAQSFVRAGVTTSSHFTGSELNRLNTLGKLFHSHELNELKLTQSAEKELTKSIRKTTAGSLIGILSFIPSIYAGQKLIDVSRAPGKLLKPQASSQADSSNVSASAALSEAVAIK